MGGTEKGYSGARIWIGWSCLVGVCERGEVKTGVLLTVVLGLGVGLDESALLGPQG